MGLNTEQIIKALECCFSNGSCDGCPYTERVDCRRELERNALALIKQQQEEIERLKLEKAGAEAGAMMFVKELQAHNENLKKENKYLRDSLSDERKHKEDMEGKDGI